MAALSACTPPFIEKLYTIVQDGPVDVVQWSPSGTSFYVISPQRLETEILARHFKSANFASFVRQLNFYGFRKLVAVTTYGSVVEFQHPKFLRNRTDLVSQIRRRTSSDYQVVARREVAVLRAENNRMKAEILRLRRELQRAWGAHAAIGAHVAAICGVTHAAKRPRLASSWPETPAVTAPGSCVTCGSTADPHYESVVESGVDSHSDSVVSGSPYDSADDPLEFLDSMSSTPDSDPGLDVPLELLSDPSLANEGSDTAAAVAAMVWPASLALAV